MFYCCMYCNHSPGSDSIRSFMGPLWKAPLLVFRLMSTSSPASYPCGLYHTIQCLVVSLGRYLEAFKLHASWVWKAWPLHVLLTSPSMWIPNDLLFASQPITFIQQELLLHPEWTHHDWAYPVAFLKYAHVVSLEQGYTGVDRPIVMLAYSAL